MEENYTIAEEYTLPSGGEIYEKPVNPHVKLRSMTTREEMRRLNKSISQYKSLADIIEACMIEKPAVSVYDMCLGDYEYLLHKLRVVTHGPNYKMDVLCPFCGRVESTSINLDEMEVLDFDVEEFKNLLTLHLPKSDKEVTLKFQTPRILDNIELKTKEMQRKSKDDQADFSLLVTLMETIDLVDGVKLNYVDKENFISKLPANDTNKILNRIAAINKTIGLRNEVHSTCSNCKEEIISFFRFGPEFFRPTED